MLRLRGVSAAVFGLLMCNPFPAFAEVAVGEATLIKTEVTGENGPLVVKAPVHRDERIRTSIGGLGQFVFRDGTKLAVGAGSSVVIDSYVYDEANSVKKLTIKAAKGTFRWISGNSSSSAYSIVTPAGTIGVRGTAFDVYVAPNGTTAMVLLNGSAQFCGAGGCKQLRQQCDCVIASRRGGVSEPRTVDEETLRTLGNQKALPFLSGNQQLSGPLGNIRTSCGLRSIRLDRRDPVREDAPEVAPSPQKQEPAPQRQEPQREPDRPQKPDKAHHHHRDDHHHWGGYRDRHDDRWGGRHDEHHAGWNGHPVGQDGGWGQRSGGRDGRHHRPGRQFASLGNQRGGQGGQPDGQRNGQVDRGGRDHADRGHRDRDHADRGAGRRGDHNGRQDRQQARSSPANGAHSGDAHTNGVHADNGQTNNRHADNRQAGNRQASVGPASDGPADGGSAEAGSGDAGRDRAENGNRQRGGWHGDGGQRARNHGRHGR
jgi:hypothetical protein